MIHKISKQVVSESGFDLTTWVDAEQNGVVSGEPLTFSGFCLNHVSGY